MEKDSESLKNAKVVEGQIADLGPDLVAALDPEAGPGLAAAPGPVAGPGLRTGPNPETVLGPEVARSRLIEKIRRLEETKEGPGLRVGPSLALNLEAGPRIGPNPGTVLNPNQDLVQNPGMIKHTNKQKWHHKLRIMHKYFSFHHGKIQSNFSIFLVKFFENIKTKHCASIALIKNENPWGKKPLDIQLTLIRKPQDFLKNHFWLKKSLEDILPTLPQTAT